MSQRMELLVVAVSGLLLVLLGVVLGRVSVDTPPAVEVVKWKEKVVWQERKTSASETTATAAKTETVRVVTRWLRPDKTVAKEQVRETGSDTRTSSVASSTHSAQAQGQSESRSESRTVVELRPRFQAQALLGLELGAGAARRWGGAVSVRIAGPVWVGAWALPGMKVGGASLAVTW